MILRAGYVAANWPPESKLIWSGVEVGLRVQSGGAGFQKCAVATERNPCAAAMINYEHGPDKSRFSWDPLTTLVAVRVRPPPALRHQKLTALSSFQATLEHLFALSKQSVEIE